MHGKNNKYRGTVLFSVVKSLQVCIFSIKRLRVCLRFMSIHVISCLRTFILMMVSEILHHPLSIEPYEKRDSLHINWCRIVSINSTKQLATWFYKHTHFWSILGLGLSMSCSANFHHLLLQSSHEKKPGCLKRDAHNLIGGFNPSQKYESKWESSPGRGENKKIKPPPSNGLWNDPYVTGYYNLPLYNPNQPAVKEISTWRIRCHLYELGRIQFVYRKKQPVFFIASWLVVEPTHLKNVLVKIGIFPN